MGDKAPTDQLIIFWSAISLILQSILLLYEWLHLYFNNTYHICNRSFGNPNLFLILCVSKNIENVDFTLLMTLCSKKFTKNQNPWKFNVDVDNWSFKNLFISKFCHSIKQTFFWILVLSSYDCELKFKSL